MQSRRAVPFFFPLSLVCCSQKVLDRKGTARKGVLPRKTRAHKVASRKEDAKRVCGGRGEGVKPPRKSVSLSEKNTREDKQSSQFFSFFEFRVWEKRFESLNVFQAFVSSSFCLSLSPQKLCCGKVRCRLDAKKKRKDGASLLFFSRERDGAK